MKQDLIEKGYIPLDKSWMIRMGVLDLVHGYDDSINYLKNHKEELNGDLLSLYKASIQWKHGEALDVGESGTLYRFLKFASWKLKIKKNFIISGTLNDRKICDDPKIINWSLEQLLTLDRGTSQWASASVLLGNKERLQNSPYKLKVTYDAVRDWETARESKACWKPRFDETILAQASSYVQWLKGGEMEFTPEQAEDYCFARAFNLITAEKGEELWPNLHGHESDRIPEMERELLKNEVTSKDHRVVQAIAMLRRNKERIMNPDCVIKSWPQFWRFLEDSKNM